ncbi:Probable RNA-directed DNA polymerase from transposon BS [Eumeta japonica]|uniref:Probable RNA-directed DNA polymerase from transposon BS n=1 Tax=Eumeta variegata TaxID=151549 RepID=A0A4C1Z7G6_EUMVA|nr:Probable RNA-directed DNA polymerase from transposon BS [Eumeta japonica]
MGPPDGRKPIPTLKISDWKKMSTALEKIDTPPLNSVPHDIRTIDEIDSAVERYNPIPALKRPDNSIALDDAEIAECLADSIETQWFYASPPHDIAHINLFEKAPGLDGISNKAIKCFSLPLFSLLVAIFNACLKHCYFSPTCKEAEVIGIHKPGKPRDHPASYRPISLLSGLGKLFERILKTRLNDHLLGKGLIIDEQFGFRPAHSCPQ